MSRSKLENTIRGVYAELEALESKYVGRMRSSLFEAYVSALASERQHRAGRKGKLSAKVAAAYFACKWVLEPCEPPKSWEEACSVRDDARLGHALGEQLRDITPKGTPQDNQLARMREAIEEIDYARDIMGRVP